MKSYKILGIFLALVMLAVPLTGCGEKTDEGNTSATTVANEESSSSITIDYSKGLDENGFFEGVKATDYVENLKYKGLEIPKDIHTISDDEVQEQIDAIVENYAESKEVKDRETVDGDTLNIDYVGSVDGVEFDGGSTGGAGTEVTIGETNYIDDFMEQLIGHKPGETFNVEVTFPEDYGQEGTEQAELNGKDAIFVTTINHIVEKENPEFTDAFVKENFSENYSLNTVDDMKKQIKEDLQKSAISTYVQDYLINDVTIKEIPDSVMNYQERMMIDYYKNMAQSSGMDFETFLTDNLQVASEAELIEQAKETNTDAANKDISVQAIAEDAKITVTEEDLAEYFLKNYNSEDYSSYEEECGMPYLKKTVLYQSVIEYITDNAVLK